MGREIAAGFLFLRIHFIAFKMARMGPQMAWFFLLIAGMLEIAWAVALPQTKGFTKLGPSLYVFAVMGVSFFCLSQALRILPIGTAYAVWTGIGAAGTAILGMALLGEPLRPLRIFYILMIVGGTVGLKFLHDRG